MKILWVLVVITAVVILWFLFTPRTFSITPQVPIVSLRSNPLSTKDIENLISETALFYGIDGDKFLATAKCESSLRPEVVGDDGYSIGLFQIHLPSHPDVTEELARDPKWATEWSAKKFKIDPTIWVCYNKLYGRLGTIHQ